MSSERHDSENYRLRVSHRGDVVISTDISELHAKTIAMLVTVGINYYGGLRPQYVPYLLQVVVRTIEAALQHDASIHSTWLNLCENYEETIQVDVEASKSLLHSGPVDPFSGGLGGAGGWFGAGGGGGGFGLLEGGLGGPGAPGAGFIMQVAEDDSVLDVVALVVAQTAQVPIWPDTERIEAACVGGGGSGGPGPRWIDFLEPRIVQLR